MERTLFPILTTIVLLVFSAVSCQDDNKSVEKPVASLGTVSDITFYTADISGKLELGKEELSQYEFGLLLSTSSDVMAINSKKYPIMDFDKDYNYTLSLSGLDSVTDYYFRSYIFYDGIYIYSDVRNFRTRSPLDIIRTGSICSDHHTVISRIESKNLLDYIQSYGVCYGNDENPTVNNQIVTTNSVDAENNFTLTLKDIDFGTVYYRAFVMIDGVTYYGNVKSFERIMPNGVAVDLGLSVKWATYNVGATKPEEYGNYYAWGETEAKTNYNWSTYKWCNGSDNTLTKYCNVSSYSNNGFTDTKTTLDLEDDVAHVKWGGSWRMPTQAEQDELLNNCTWKWTTVNGVNGYRVTSKKSGYTDRSIFIPSAGCRVDSDLRLVGSLGRYWSSSVGTDSPNWDTPYTAWDITFSSSYVIVLNGSIRTCGLTVRPVCPSVEWLSSVNVSLVEDNKTLLVGGSAILNATVIQNNKKLSSAPVMWFSDNPAVAIVDNEGVVTALSAGTAHVTASIQTLSDQCTVTVIEDSNVESEYVDLGLSVKWATFNVGALSPEDLGAYYSWGEIETKTKYWVDNYKWYKWSGDTSTITKYNIHSSYGSIDNKTTLDPEDDVAHVKWGGNWRMPTRAEQDELLNNCAWIWTTLNGVNGYRVTSKKSGFTDRSIFLPAAGERFVTSLRFVGSHGNYWSSSLHAGYSDFAWSNYFYSSEVNLYYQNDRCIGYSVRPVCP